MRWSGGHDGQEALQLFEATSTLAAMSHIARFTLDRSAHAANAINLLFQLLPSRSTLLFPQPTGASSSSLVLQHLSHLPSSLPAALYTCLQQQNTTIGDAGDIDFLILPPPSRNTLPCGQLLQALLSQLLQQGLLLDEMSPERPRPRDSGSATWLGLCKPPGSPFVRRIDFKVYPSK